MTDERKNEIWAMLPADFKTYVRRWYQDVIDNDEHTEHIFEGLFGTHNLTAQAEEKPKEPNYIADTSKKVDYAQYRFDLAKEIAVAMIGEKAIGYGDIADIAVEIANEIVKRLKETDNENA